MEKTDKKWKPGQLITLWGKVYRICKCKYSEKYKACFVCGQLNGRTPCIDAADYPEKPGFSTYTCMKKMPEGCIPKRLKLRTNVKLK